MMIKNDRLAREKERKKRLILDAAKELFVREGFDNVSLRRVAAKAGYSPAAIYRYFKNKREILSVLRNEGFAQFHKLQEQHLSIEDPLQRLKQSGWTYMNFALSDPDSFQLMYGTTVEDVEMEGPLAAKSECQMNLFRHYVKTAVETGHFGDADPEGVAMALWATVHGLASLINKGQLPPMSEEALQDLLERAMEFAGRPSIGWKSSFID